MKVDLQTQIDAIKSMLKEMGLGKYAPNVKDKRTMERAADMILRRAKTVDGQKGTDFYKKIKPRFAKIGIKTTASMTKAEVQQVMGYLVEAGRMDLAKKLGRSTVVGKKFRRKFGSKPINNYDDFVEAWRDEIDRGTYWEDAFSVVEKRYGKRIPGSDFNKLNKLFKKKFGTTPDSWMEA
jgi:hypothetical protein